MKLETEELHLNIKVLSQENHKVELSSFQILLKSKNIFKIKEEISKKFNQVPPKDQTLIHHGIKMKDEENIDFYLKDLSEPVYLVLNPLKIYIKSMNGSLSCLNELSPKMSIESLKELVEKKIGVFFEYSLVFEGKNLMEGKELCDYNIVDGSVVHLIKK
jgi:hypothetical protein